MSTPIASFIGPFQVPHLLHCEVLEATEDQSLAPQEQAVLRNALRTGYVVDSTRRPRDYGYTRVSTLWRAWCEKMAIPFVRFLPRKLYSPAELDLRPARTLIKREYCGQLREAILSYDTTRQPRNAIGPDRWSGGQIPVGKIHEVASILLDAALHWCEPDGNGMPTS